MINPNELRLGNLAFNDKNQIVEVVRIETEKYTKWDSGNEFSIIFKALDNSENYYQGIIKPIPITEEFFKDRGFQIHPYLKDVQLGQGYRL